VKHHEYFHGHRENGRLTLKLVTLDNNDDDYFMGTNEEEEEQEQEQEEELASLPTSPKEINNVTIDQSVVINDGFEEKEENKDNTQKSFCDGDEVLVENENEIVGGANSKGNCLNCNSVISASSGIFGVFPLHPLSPLRVVRG
jgi:hypothetical protein